MAPENIARTMAQLEGRIRDLERAIQVKPNGNIEIRATGTLKIEAQAGVEISSNTSVKVFDFFGNEIRLNATGITMGTGAKFTVNTSTFDVVSGMVQFSAGVSKFSGVAQCDTLIANNVVGSSYTPGAGNLY